MAQKDRRKVKGRKITAAAREAIAINHAIRETGELPKPRIEVRQTGRMFLFRVRDKYGRKGAWSHAFSRRNNARRAARVAHPDLPIVSL